MEKELFSTIALDALGDMMNISLGSSATAVSNMLDRRVDITTPEVSVVKKSEFSLGKMEPAMGVEIRYVEGLDGSNIMLLKISDIKVIVDILMGTESSDDEFELNELTISCVCELMNQMMGAASTALSDFLGYPVNISTPEPFELEDMDAFKAEHMPQDADTVVVVKFALSIEDAALESGFMNVMSVSLAKDLLSSFGLELDDDAPAAAPAPAPAAPAPAPEPADSGDSNRKMSQEEIERMLAGGADQAPPPPPEPEGDSNRKMSQEEIERMLAGGVVDQAPPPPPEPEGDSNRKMSQEEIERMLAGGVDQAPPPPPQQAPAAAAQTGQPQAGQMPPPPYPPQPGMDGNAQGYMGYPPMYYPPYPYPYPPQAEPQKAPSEPKVISTQPLPMGPLDAMEQLGKEQAQNLELIMEVPLQVTVEIGRARRKVQDILEFAKGSLVVLDKLAGDQVDLFVNGKIIARGEVVVIEDNFGVRITEIVQTPGIEMLASKAKEP